MQSTMTGTEADPVATDETDRLIASNKVEGTAVYNRSGERLGEVYNFMVDKYSGQVAYAVMSFGGFLGIGESYHPLPWRVLDYDTGMGGYIVDLDKDKLRGAPSFSRDENSGLEPGVGDAGGRLLRRAVLLGSMSGAGLPRQRMAGGRGGAGQGVRPRVVPCLTPVWHG